MNKALIFVIAILVVCGDGAFQPAIADDSDKIGAVIFASGILSFSFSALSSLANAKYLSRGTPNKISGTVGVVAGVPTALVGILWIESQYSKRNPEGVATCLIFGVVGITSVVLGVMNLRSEGITNTLGGQYKVRICPELTRGDRGEVEYRLGMTFSY